LLAGAAAVVAPQGAWAYGINRQGDDDFTVTPSGLRFLELREGAGDTPRAGACAHTPAPNPAAAQTPARTRERSAPQ
jgi:hypothetical protein